MIDQKRRKMALLCAIYASDRAAKKQTIDLPSPGSPACNALFRATWEAFRHVTTKLGKRHLTARGIRTRELDPLEAFVHGREIPAHIRWAETEAMILAGEWTGDAT